MWGGGGGGGGGVCVCVLFAFALLWIFIVRSRFAPAAASRKRIRVLDQTAHYSSHLSSFVTPYTRPPRLYGHGENFMVIFTTLTRKVSQVSLTDFNDSLICCRTSKNKTHVIFFIGGKTDLEGEIDP